jgi:hypothetical protein
VFTIDPATTVEDEEVPEEPEEPEEEDGEGAAGVATCTVDVPADGS